MNASPAARERFRRVIEAALVKPLAQLPYRPPVRTRWHQADRTTPAPGTSTAVYSRRRADR